MTSVREQSISVCLPPDFGVASDAEILQQQPPPVVAVPPRLSDVSTIGTTIAAVPYQRVISPATPKMRIYVSRVDDLYYSKVCTWNPQLTGELWDLIRLIGRKLRVEGLLDEHRTGLFLVEKGTKQLHEIDCMDDILDGDQLALETFARRALPALNDTLMDAVTVDTPATPRVSNVAAITTTTAPKAGKKKSPTQERVAIFATKKTAAKALPAKKNGSEKKGKVQELAMLMKDHDNILFLNDENVFRDSRSTKTPQPLFTVKVSEPHQERKMVESKRKEPALAAQPQSKRIKAEEGDSKPRARTKNLTSKVADDGDDDEEEDPYAIGQKFFILDENDGFGGNEYPAIIIHPQSRKLRANERRVAWIGYTGELIVNTSKLLPYNRERQVHYHNVIVPKLVQKEQEEECGRTSGVDAPGILEIDKTYYVREPSRVEYPVRLVRFCEGQVDKVRIEFVGYGTQRIVHRSVLLRATPEREANFELQKMVAKLAKPSNGHRPPTRKCKAEEVSPPPEVPAPIVEPSPPTGVTNNCDGQSGSQHSDLWNKRYEELKSYVEANGDCLVPAPYEPNSSLRNWVATQRRLKRTGKLREDRQQRLQNLGFIWEVCNSHKEELEKQWNNRYDELKAYFHEYGNCLVPTDYKLNPPLGFWVMAQRSLKRNGRLSEDRQRRLQQLDFVWEIGLSRRAEWDKQWNRRYDELKVYKRKHGNCLVPRAYKHSPGLGKWVTSQRHLKKHGQLRADRVILLRQLELWRDHQPKSNETLVKDDESQLLCSHEGKWERLWSQRYEELKAFVEEHGDCVIPRGYRQNPSLESWVLTQRKLYRNGKLREDRKQLLQQLGFVWDVQQVSSAHTDSCAERWNKRCEELKAHIDAHGDCLVPQGQSPGLASWVAQQRYCNKKGQLGDDRKDQLQQLGLFGDVKAKNKDVATGITFAQVASIERVDPDRPKNQSNSPSDVAERDDIDFFFGPPTDTANLPTRTAIHEIGYGSFKRERSRIVYIAIEDEQPEMIADKFQVPVGKLLYDNQRIWKGLQAKSHFKRGTPIVLPLTWNEIEVGLNVAPANIHKIERNHYADRIDILEGKKDLVHVGEPLDSDMEDGVGQLSIGKQLHAGGRKLQMDFGQTHVSNRLGDSNNQSVASNDSSDWTDEDIRVSF